MKTFFKKTLSLKWALRILLLILPMYIFSCNSREEKIVQEELQITQCGTLQFSAECGQEADSLNSLGLALIHNMTYDESREIFEQVMEKYPDCFWGPWGKAMSFIHPLWSDPPSDSLLAVGWELAQKSKALAENEQQVQFASAIGAYYENGIGKTEQERLKKFYQSWESAYEQFPENLEIKSFLALSMIAVADPNDKTYANQVKAGKMAEEILQKVPEHPGGIHYTIHAYDYPELADKAVKAAENYGAIAPEVAHALHMPTHIYTRLGMWEESIAWNNRSAKAAMENPGPGAVSMHYFHALDYIVYAHLQRLEDEQVKTILAGIKQLKEPIQQHNATAYSIAALEGRMALERQNWSQAANLKARQPSSVNWEKFPEFEALSHFAIGLGAARSGEHPKAMEALENLERLKQKIQNKYWKDQIDIQSKTVKAWLLLNQGKNEEGLQSMRLAAQMELATNKHPITPGELLPASELLGDMLMDMGEPGEALIHYEQALVRSPGRFNSLFGAAKAADLLGEHQKAKKYYQTLLTQSQKSEGNQDRKEEAIKYISKKQIAT
jgi:tetratricopeptide (TPR) repeat protein